MNSSRHPKLKHAWQGSPSWQRCAREGCTAVRLLRGIPGDKRPHFEQLGSDTPPALTEPPCRGDMPFPGPVHVDDFDPMPLL